ncbi:hypothetical protein D3C87_259520 [compost metagenome]
MKKTENKIIRTGKALTFLIVLAAVAALAAAEIIYETSGTARFKLSKEGGVRKTTTTSQEYLLYRAFGDDGGDQLYLTSAQRTRSYFLDAEGVEGATSWTVRTGPKLNKVLWSKTENSTTLELNENLGALVSGLEGCCASVTGYRLYEIETGKLLMSFNDYSFDRSSAQPFSLEVPNSPLKYRFIGILGADSTRDIDFVTPVAGHESVALVKYGNPYLRQKLQVDMKMAPGYGPSILEVSIEKDPGVPNSDKIEIDGRQAKLWNIDGSGNANDVAGVVLKFSVNAGYGTQEVIIPIRQDRLALDKATIPEGIQIRSIAP